MPIARAIRLSIRAKVLLLALGLALPPLIVVSLLGLSSLNSARNTAMRISTDALRAQAEANLEKRAADKARLYNATMEDIQRQVQGTATNVSSLLAAGSPPPAAGRIWVSPDGPTPANEREYAESVARARQLIPILSTATERNPLISLGYVALDEGGVVAFDHDIIDTLLSARPFDAHVRPWYVAARDTGQTVWVDTYVDANTKKLVTTCATPLYDSRDAFVGVVAFDLLLDTIQQDLLKLDMGQAGYAFLINNQGKVLVRPDMQAGGRGWNEPFAAENLLETDDPKLRGAFERMTQQQSDVELLRYQGEDVYLAYAPIKSAGWSVGIVIPEAEVIRPAEQVGGAIADTERQLRTQVLAVFGLSVVAVLALGAVFSVLLTRPLRQLQSGAQRIAAGDLRYRMAQAGTNDEIGDLVGSFNMMSNALNQKLAELENNLRELATLNEVSNSFKAFLSLPQLFDAVPRLVCERFGFERAVLYMVEDGALRAVAASFGRDAQEQETEFIHAANVEPIALDSDTVEADILRSGQAVIVDNPWEHPRVSQAKQQVARSESYVQVPIFGHEEKIIGLLSADYHYSKRAVNARDAAQLLMYASMVGLTIENTRLYSELERQVAERTTELRSALTRAQEADRLKGQFLASISHELRTPLNAIIGFSTVMLDELDGPISAMQREDLKTINQNGRFLLHLINELLDLARIEAGKIELDIRKFDLGQTIGEVVETVGGLLYQKPIALRAALPPSLPPACADPGKVRQILLNLLSNAVKFTEKGAITIAAQCVIMSDEAALERAAGEPATNGYARSLVARDGRRITPYLAVSVRDTGIGIAPEHLPLIFDEFRQVASRRGEKQGSGLGLSICRSLIEAHGGRIWVESTPGQGSTFTFTLPCAIEPKAGGREPEAMVERLESLKV